LHLTTSSRVMDRAYSTYLPVPAWGTKFITTGCSVFNTRHSLWWVC